MPYTNTQHPSNTRTTVTIVLSIIFGVSIIPTTALGALYFNLENSDVPTLYQEVKVKIRRGPPIGAGSDTAKDVVFEATDKVYFIDTTDTTAAVCSPPCTEANKQNCNTRPTCVVGGLCSKTPPAGVTLWDVVPATVGGVTSAMVNVVVKNAEFKVSNSYKICYLKKDKTGGAAAANPAVYSAVYDALYKLTDAGGASDFTIVNSIYTSPVITPAANTVFGGQGPVRLSITAVAIVGSTLGKNEIKERPYLIRCRDAQCSNKDELASLCSKDNAGTVTTGEVTGFGTGTLTTTFTAPVTPAASYGICIPYCFKAGKCDSAISWALVNSDTAIKFKPTDPLSYSISPLNGAFEMSVTGTDLKVGDKIRILTKGQVAKGDLCPSSSTLVQNTYIEVKATSATGTGSSVLSKFPITAVLAASITGQVCYRRAGTPNLWSPVFQIPKPNTHLYFNLENARYPTLYQEVNIKLRKGSVARTPQNVFKETDKVYFIEKAEGTPENLCVVSPPTTGVTLWGVVPSTGGASAIVTVIIKNGEFTVGKTYKMCYLEKGATKSPVYSSVVEASYTLIDGIEASVKFTVLNSMFTEHVITPSTPVFGGQGPVTLSITAGMLGTGSPLGNGQGAKRPYLIPCKDAECSNKNELAALCSLTNNPGTVPTGEVTGFGTGTLTASFTAPVTPAASYGICVPYCFNAGKCESAISWALVNSDTPIKFLAKPTTEPQSPPKSDNDGKPDTVPPKPEVTKTIPATPTSDPIVVRPQHNKTTTTKGESATAISSTIPAVLITSVVFLYLYK